MFGRKVFSVSTVTCRAAADQILSRDIPWEGYQRANLIDAKELELIKKYDKQTEEVRRVLIVQVSYSFCVE